MIKDTKNEPFHPERLDERDDLRGTKRKISRSATLPSHSDQFKEVNDICKRVNKQSRVTRMEAAETDADDAIEIEIKEELSSDTKMETTETTGDYAIKIEIKEEITSDTEVELQDSNKSESIENSLICETTIDARDPEVMKSQFSHVSEIFSSEGHSSEPYASISAGINQKRLNTENLSVRRPPIPKPYLPELQNGERRDLLESIHQQIVLFNSTVGEVNQNVNDPVVKIKSSVMGVHANRIRTQNENKLNTTGNMNQNKVPTSLNIQDTQYGERQKLLQSIKQQVMQFNSFSDGNVHNLVAEIESSSNKVLLSLSNIRAPQNRNYGQRNYGQRNKRGNAA